MTEVFSYRSTKSGYVFISFQGKRVTTLRGSKADAFLARASGSGADEQQALMQRATGNFKHGNER